MVIKIKLPGSVHIRLCFCVFLPFFVAIYTLSPVMCSVLGLGRFGGSKARCGVGQTPSINPTSVTRRGVVSVRPHQSTLPLSQSEVWCQSDPSNQPYLCHKARCGVGQTPSINPTSVTKRGVVSVRPHQSTLPLSQGEVWCQSDPIIQPYLCHKARCGVGQTPSINSPSVILNVACWVDPIVGFDVPAILLLAPPVTSLGSTLPY
jgi:hypothetical protein